MRAPTETLSILGWMWVIMDFVSFFYFCFCVYSSLLWARGKLSAAASHPLLVEALTAIYRLL